MKPAKGKTTALWTLVLGILVLMALGIGSRDRVLVELYARALKSGSVEEKLRAARELGKMKSVKAVPVLLEALKQAMAPNRGSISDSLRRAIRGALLSIGEPAMLCLMRGLKDEDWRLLLPDADETLGQFFLQPVPKNVNGESAIVHALRLLTALHEDERNTREVRAAAAEAWGSIQAFRSFSLPLRLGQGF